MEASSETVRRRLALRPSSMQMLRAIVYSQVEKRAVYDATISAGAREASLDSGPVQRAVTGDQAAVAGVDRTQQARRPRTR